MYRTPLILALLVFSTGGAEVLPTAEGIDRLAEAAKSIASGFKTASNELRFQYEYSGRFLNPADKEKLHALAAQGSEQLRKIVESQQGLKNQIEAYEGDDWEDRYGATGLWRKLFTDLYVTNAGRLEIDFHIALHSDSATRYEKAHQMLDRIDALKQDYDTAYLQFLRAKALGLPASKDPAYKSLARQQFDLLSERSDMRQSTAFRIAIERIKLLGPGENSRLAQLTGELVRSDVNDPELILSVACLQHRLDMPRAFEETVNLRPGMLDSFVGVLALRDLDYRLEHDELDLAKTSLFEAELAVQTAWRDVPADWVGLLRCFVQSEKFRTPLILYVAALACAEASPAEAVELLMLAAELQKDDESKRLGIEAETIAEQAARLTCNAYAKGQLDQDAVLGIFDGFERIAGECSDDELEYCYATALMAAGQTEKAAELLRKIAATPQATRRCRAKLDLITSAITRDHFSDPNKKAEASADLLDFLDQCSEEGGPDRVRPEAIRMYCRLLLEPPQAADAQKVLNILTDSEVQNEPDLKAFKSKALRHLNKLEEAAESLAGIYQTNNPKYALEAELLLVRIIEKYEQLQHDSADPAKLQKHSLAIARYCERVSQSSFGLIPVERAKLYVLEISLFGADANPQKLSQIEESLKALPDEYKKDDGDFLRCRARLLAEQGRFAEAARVWTKVAAAEKRRSAPPNQRNAPWWRAKYYELFCFSRIPQTQDKDVAHSIEVLQSSYADIPPLWAERLNLLKQQCSKGDDNSQCL